MKIKRELLILLLIVVLGLFLRLYKLNQTSLYGDELTLVYDAYSILKTGGYDQNGVFLPLTFKMAEGRPAAYVYFSIPFVAIFGPSETGARLLSVFSGVGIIILMFYLGRILFNKRVGLIAAALTTFSPWDIQLSHGGFETHFALFLTLLGVVLALSSSSRKYFLILSALSFGLAIHTYSTYKLTVPLLLVVMFLYLGNYKQWFGRKLIIWSFSSLIVIIIAGILLVSQALTAGSEGRFLNLNVFNRSALKEQIIQKINLERNLDELPVNLPALFHNKSLEYSFVILESFVGNFSPEFLFWHGDGNPRHNGATMGELYPVEVIFVLTGLGYFIIKKKRAVLLLLPWLALAAIPATLLMEPHALRDSLMLPPLITLSAMGVLCFWEFAKSKRMGWIKVFILLSFLLPFIIFVDRFYFISPREFSRFWSYPAKLASNIVIQERDKFDFVILSDRLDNIEFAYPVYASIDPNLVIAQNKQRTTLDKYNFKKLGNVYIGSIPDGEEENFINWLPGSVLYIGPSTESKYLSSYEVLNSKDNLPALVYKKKT